MSQAGVMPGRLDPRHPRPRPSLDLAGLAAPFCGGGWLARQLARHPRLVMNWQDDLLSPGLGQPRPAAWQETWSAAAAGKTGPHLLHGSYHPNYFFSSQAIKALARGFPRARLYVAVRNPLARALSDYLDHLRRGGAHPQDQPLRFIMQEARLGMVEKGFYDHHLRQWLDYFPRNQLSVVLYEDMLSRPAAVLAELGRFLGLEETWERWPLPPEQPEPAGGPLELDMDVLAFLEETYAGVREYFARLLERNLSELWSAQAALSLGRAVMDQRPVQLARALTLFYKGPDHYPLAFPLLRDLCAARAPYAQAYQALASILEYSGQALEAERVRALCSPA